MKIENCPAESDLDSVERFTYWPETNTYVCPEGKQLTYVGVNARNRTRMYAATPKRCRLKGSNLVTGNV